MTAANGVVSTRIIRAAGRLAVVVLGGAIAVGAGIAAIMAVAAAETGDTGGLPAPREHFALPDPAALDGPAAEAAYRSVRPSMLAAYQLSRDPITRRYPSWQRYNDVPYLSKQHGRRYVNIYANPAAAYGDFELGVGYPPGAVIVKDSFSVAADGARYPAPLFIMERLAPGASPATDDWRYTMYLPDGTLFGTTDGAGSDKVAFCADCHKKAETGTGMFFPPTARRR